MPDDGLWCGACLWRHALQDGALIDLSIHGRRVGIRRRIFCTAPLYYSELVPREELAGLAGTLDRVRDLLIAFQHAESAADRRRSGSMQFTCPLLMLPGQITPVIVRANFAKRGWRERAIVFSHSQLDWNDLALG